jgi:MFS family permease
MAGAMVAQSFGRFTFGVVLPAVRDDLLGGSNGAAGFLGTANVVAYLVGTLAVAAAASRFSLVGLVRVGLVLSTAGLLLASVAPNGPVLAIALVAMGWAAPPSGSPHPAWPLPPCRPNVEALRPGWSAWASGWESCSPAASPTCSATAKATKRGATSTSWRA